VRVDRKMNNFDRISIASYDDFIFCVDNYFANDTRSAQTY